MDVQGFGRQKGHSEVYRGHEISVKSHTQGATDDRGNEDFVEPTINAVIKGGRTGAQGENR